MSYSTLTHRVDEGIAEVILSRPPLNPINQEMERELAECLTGLRADDSVRCLVLRGEGDRAFSVGGDIHELYARSVNPNPRTSVAVVNHCSWLLENLPIPTVSAISGHCLGGGLELALCTDVRFAHPDSSLGFPEVRIGLFPGMGGTQRLKMLVGPSIAKEMILGGEPIAAARAVEIGLVNGLDPDPARRAIGWAEAVIQGGPLAQRLAKAVIDQGSSPTVETLVAEQFAWAEVWASKDRSVGMEAFKAKEQPRFQGS